MFEEQEAILKVVHVNPLKLNCQGIRERRVLAVKHQRAQPDSEAADQGMSLSAVNRTTL